MASTPDDPTAILLGGAPTQPSNSFDHFLSYYGTLVYPLAEHESPSQIYENVNAMASTARWWNLSRILQTWGKNPCWPGSMDGASYGQLSDVSVFAQHPEWPVLYKGRRLAMVIRQWVEEEPSRYVAEELRHSEEWNQFLQYASGQPDFQLPSARWGPLQINVVGTYLEHAGLPSNPATARHLLALVNGASKPYPARGILVTTLCYTTPPYSDELPEPLPGPIRFAHPGETMISGVTQWMPGPLLARVNEVVRRHQQFMEQNEAAPYVPTSKGTRNRARQMVHGRTPSASSLDYIASAVRDIREQGLVPTDEQDSRFVQACTASYRATYNRIRAHNKSHPDESAIPTKPPDNWRITVFDLLRK